MLNDADAAGIAEARFGAAKGVARRRHPADLRHRHRQRAAASTARWCPTPSSATSNSTATTPRSAPPRRCARNTRCPTRSGPSGCSATWQHVERLFTPDLFVVGGGVSKDADKWVPLLELAHAGQAGPAAQRRRHRRRRDRRRRDATASRSGARHAAPRVARTADRQQPQYNVTTGLRTYWTRSLSRPTDGLLPTAPASRATRRSLSRPDAMRSRAPVVKGHQWYPARTLTNVSSDAASPRSRQDRGGRQRHEADERSGEVRGEEGAGEGRGEDARDQGGAEAGAQPRQPPRRPRRPPARPPRRRPATKAAATEGGKAETAAAGTATEVDEDAEPEPTPTSARTARSRRSSPGTTRRSPRRCGRRARTPR